MKTITETVYLIATPASYEESGYWHRIAAYMPDDAIVLRSMEVEMSIPEDFDYVNPQIDILKKEKQRINVEAQLKVNNLEEQIQSLLAIEAPK